MAVRTVEKTRDVVRGASQKMCVGYLQKDHVRWDDNKRHYLPCTQCNAAGQQRGQGGNKRLVERRCHEKWAAWPRFNGRVIVSLHAACDDVATPCRKYDKWLNKVAYLVGLCRNVLRRRRRNRGSNLGWWAALLAMRRVVLQLCKAGI